MIKKYNQIVITKVENGFIFSMQSPQKSGGLFGMEKQVDKKHYVASNIQELEKLIKDLCSKLVTTEDIVKELKNSASNEEDIEEDEDDEEDSAD